MPKIVVIDDEPSITMILGDLLRYEGYEVSTFHSGTAALDAIREGLRPSLVIVDLHLPDIPGRKVVEELNSIPGMHEIPIFLLTGASPCDDSFPPSDHYREIIPKPFELIDVLNKIRAFTA